jgi:AcrR family transcriptional regulator
MSKTRGYVLHKRAESQAATRQRIVESTVDLHQEVGPARTQISEVARRASVQRATVYKHFPREAELLAACSAHWRALHPMPDPQPWSEIEVHGERLRVGLKQVYRWYRETKPMTENVLRDAPTMTALDAIITNGLLRNLDRLVDMLVEPFGARGKRAERIRLACRTAIDFAFWRNLQPLTDEQAARLGAGLVELAADDSVLDRLLAASSRQVPG